MTGTPTGWRSSRAMLGLRRGPEYSASNKGCKPRSSRALAAKDGPAGDASTATMLAAPPNRSPIRSTSAGQPAGSNAVS